MTATLRAMRDNFVASRVDGYRAEIKTLREAKLWLRERIDNLRFERLYLRAQVKKLNKQVLNLKRKGE